MNKTKIIATIGPASADKEVLKELIINGMDVARLNLSHADYRFCTDIITKINELNEELGTNVAVMLDTLGPCIRTGHFAGGSAYLKGDKIRIYMDKFLVIVLNFQLVIQGLSMMLNTTPLLLDDGRIDLEVIDKGEGYLLCEVEKGIIENCKGVNVPGTQLKMPF